MTSMSNTLRAKPPTLAWARRSRLAPAAWRLWTAAAAFTVANSITGYTALVVCIAIALVVWEMVGSAASVYPLSNREDDRPLGLRVREFLASAALLTSYLMWAGVIGAGLIGSEPVRVPILLLAASVLCCWLAFRMVRHWWSPVFMGLAAVLFPAIGFLIAWSAGGSVDNHGAILFVDAIIRIGLVGGLVSLLTWASRWPVVSRWIADAVAAVRHTNLSSARAARSGLLVALLALLLTVDLAAAGLWPVTVAGILVVTATMLYDASFHVVRDGRWMTGKRDAKYGTQSAIGVFRAVSFLPAIGLAGAASWPVWLAVTGMSAVACVLREAAESVRRRSVATKVTIAKAKPKRIHLVALPYGPAADG